MTDTALIEHQGNQGGAMTATAMQAQVQRIQEIMHSVMKVDVHYGNIPGTDKPSLLKAGAEKLCMVFRLGPDYDIVDKDRDGDHLTITSKCTLTHIPSGQRIGSALGSCSTMESKYAYRKGVRKCPQCSAAAIMKSKYPPRDNPNAKPGWWCNPKAGGCGGNFPAGDPAIESQETGRVDNEDKADQYNTVLKMSNKRALLAAVLNATAASDIFSQDLADDDGTITAAGEDAQANAKPAKRTVAEPKKKAPPAAQEATGNAPTGKINPTHIRVLNRKLDDCGDRKMDVLAELLASYKLDKLDDLPFANLNDVIKHLEAQAQP